MNETLYIVTDTGQTFDTYVTFIETYVKLLRPYWQPRAIPKKSHRFYLRGIYSHLSINRMQVAILQDVQTKQIYLVDNNYIKKEE